MQGGGTVPPATVQHLSQSISLSLSLSLSFCKVEQEVALPPARQHSPLLGVERTATEVPNVIRIQLNDNTT